jgi:redox-regulated HSP33 family molecular chaperone
VHKENDPEVAADIERLLAISKDMHSKISLEANEKSLLKNKASSGILVSLVEKYMDGVIYGWDGSASISETVEEAAACFDMLKKNLYN